MRIQFLLFSICSIIGLDKSLNSISSSCHDELFRSLFQADFGKIDLNLEMIIFIIVFIF